MPPGGHFSAAQNHSFLKELPAFIFAAFFSFCISFFCLFDLGAAFCAFLCSLFATFLPAFLCEKYESFSTPHCTGEKAKAARSFHPVYLLSVLYQIHLRTGTTRDLFPTRHDSLGSDYPITSDIACPAAIVALPKSPPRV